MATIIGYPRTLFDEVHGQITKLDGSGIVIDVNVPVPQVVFVAGFDLRSSPTGAILYNNSTSRPPKGQFDKCCSDLKRAVNNDHITWSVAKEIQISGLLRLLSSSEVFNLPSHVRDAMLSLTSRLMPFVNLKGFSLPIAAGSIFIWSVNKVYDLQLPVAEVAKFLECKVSEINSMLKRMLVVASSHSELKPWTRSAIPFVARYFARLVAAAAELKFQPWDLTEKALLKRGFGGLLRTFKNRSNTPLGWVGAFLYRLSRRDPSAHHPSQKAIADSCLVSLSTLRSRLDDWNEWEKKCALAKAEAKAEAEA